MASGDDQVVTSGLPERRPVLLEHSTDVSVPVPWPVEVDLTTLWP